MKKYLKISLLFFSLFIIGCGQSGHLYLPIKNNHENTHATSD